MARAHGDVIGKAVDEVVEAYLPRSTRVDTSALIAGLTNALARAADELETKQRTLETELADDAAPRQTRDAVAQDLYDRVVTFRAVVEAVCGPGAVRSLGFGGTTPRDPTQLLSLTRAMLANASRTRLKPTQPGISFDVRRATEGMEQLCDQLERALQAVRKEDKEADAALIARDQAQEQLDQRRMAIATLLEQFCLLAGMDELSQRVRPTNRRSGHRRERQDDSPAGPSDPAGPGSSDRRNPAG